MTWDQSLAAPSATTLLPGTSQASGFAIVKPVFTATAYSSFYTFYGEHARIQAGNFIKDKTSLKLLNASVIDSWGWSNQLVVFARSKSLSQLNLSPVLITDIDVHEGRLFQSGVRRYDVLLLGFTEYVTAKEYGEYRRFVSSGGKIIFLDATQFLAEVTYHPSSGRVSLKAGHGWEFNGTHAWKGPYHRWFDENTRWVGSNYGVFFSGRTTFKGAMPNPSHPLGERLTETSGSDNLFFKSYVHREENVVTNKSARIIARWVLQGADPSNVVAAYELKSGKGTVLHTGVFGSDLIGRDEQFKVFVLNMIAYTLDHPAQQPRLSHNPIPLVILSASFAVARRQTMDSQSN